MNLRYTLALIASVLLLMVGLYSRGQAVGAKAEELRQRRHTEKQLNRAREVSNAIDRTTDSDVTERLRDRWTR